jgi:hypothetical protein
MLERTRFQAFAARLLPKIPSELPWLGSNANRPKSSSAAKRHGLRSANWGHAARGGRSAGRRSQRRDRRVHPRSLGAGRDRARSEPRTWGRRFRRQRRVRATPRDCESGPGGEEDGGGGREAGEVADAVAQRQCFRDGAAGGGVKDWILAPRAGSAADTRGCRSASAARSGGERPSPAWGGRSQRSRTTVSPRRG